ncbi:hypothetical protein RDABS01_037816 [Bienertia sinuspersici]
MQQTSLISHFLTPNLKKDGNFSHGANLIVSGADALNCSTLAKKSIGKPVIEIKKLVPDVVQVIKMAIEEVIDLGAI